MRKRTTFAALALALLVAGCGQQATPRDAVASYVKQVNKIESALARPLATVTSTASEFTHEQAAGGTLTNLLTTSHEQALLGAWAKVEALRSRLAAVKAPPAAAHLRSLLLQIIDGQAQLTREVADLVNYLPGLSTALRPLAPATRRLQAALGSTAIAPTLASKAAALRRFQRTVDGVLAELDRLAPPPVSRPGYETQLASLRGMSSNAGRIAAALSSGAQANVQQLIAGFDRAASLDQTTAAQKAQIAAVRSYDAQSARLQRLSQAAEEERLRLADTLS